MATAQPTIKEFVRLEDVTKNFGGVRALSGVTLTANSGQVLALVGENGAGKSTLMNILSGTYPEGSYGGKIYLEGKEVGFKSPAEAEAAGITIIHQELSGFAHLSVAENMWVGHWPTKGLLIDWAKMHATARKWLDKVGANAIDTELTMNELSVGGQQLVEIAKALSRNSKLLILDEPTSSLTPREVETLLKLIKQLRAEGQALIYISHKMEEVYELADQVTVLRDGKSVWTAPRAEVNETILVAKMVGRSMENMYPAPPARDADYQNQTVLKVTNLVLHAVEGSRKIGPVNFEVKRGEIFGMAGLLGAGRTEIARAIVGGDPHKYRATGEITINGKSVLEKGPRGGFQVGAGLVCEDRKRDSIFPIRSLNENASISRLATSFLAKILNQPQEVKQSDEILKKLRTRFDTQEQKIAELSGGNQQKVVIGRILETTPDVIVLDEPTRGVDVGAKFEIYQILFELAAQGKTLIVISSDLPELMALADRLIVVSDGQQTGELQRGDYSQEQIMSLAIRSSKQVLA